MSTIAEKTVFETLNKIYPNTIDIDAWSNIMMEEYKKNKTGQGVTSYNDWIKKDGFVWFASEYLGIKETPQQITQKIQTVIVQKSTNWKLIGGITFSVLAIATVLYFIFRKKATQTTEIVKV